MTQIMVVGTILILGTGVLIFWYAARTQGYELNGRAISPLAQAPPLDLTDQNGSPFTLSQELGKIAVVSFGSTGCPAGPATLGDFETIRSNLGDYAYLVDFIFVTLDPEHDTQDHLNEALAAVDSSFIGLRGTNEQTTQVLESYGITSQPSGEATATAGCQIDYESRMYLIDKDGNLRVTYLPGTDPLKVAPDIEHLART
jgi:protein SCO1/2